MAAPTREEAWELVTEWTASDSLRKHALAVEASMRAYARIWNEEEERYAITGLVHDLDYERYPDLDTGHPRIALAELEKLGYPQDVIDAVAGHAEFLEVPRETQLAKTLFAVDELSGFVTACAKVRPTGIDGMKVKSVRKKLKQPSFAAKVDRSQIDRAIAELGVDEVEHIGVVIEALSGEAEALGLTADQVAAASGESPGS
jgi:predicted hydrolase (HD superfamily)